MSERTEGRAAAAVHSLTLDTEPYLSCDECFDAVDAEVERLIEDGRPLDEAFRVHLLGCAACREEAVTLAALLAADRGQSEEVATTLLDAALSL